MINKDYIMRLIEQLNLVLSRLLFLKDTAEYEEMLKEISASYSKITGVDPGFVHNLSTESLIQFLRPGGRYESEKSMIIARLLYEETSVMKLNNQDPLIIENQIEKSLNLYLEAYINNPEITFIKDNIEIILPDFPVLESDSHTRLRLYKYYESEGKYSRAEDILYSIFDENTAGIKNEIVSFYKRLEKKTDEELEQGNLPRGEINEALQKII